MPHSDPHITFQLPRSSLKIAGIAFCVGVLLFLVVWLNAGLLLTFPGNFGSQVQLLALGLILIGAALLNGITTRRFSGSK